MKKVNRTFFGICFLLLFPTFVSSCTRSPGSRRGGETDKRERRTDVRRAGGG